MTAGALAVMAALTALATALSLSGSPRPPRPLLTGPPERPDTSRQVRLVAPGAGVALAAAVLLLDGVRLAVATVLLVAAVGALHLRRRERRRQVAARVRGAVAEVGETLVGELRAGRDVQTALVRAADVWAPFGAVARAAALGADVPAALHRVGREPGAEGLRALAVGWAVAERTGAGLADVLTEVVQGARGVHEDLRTVVTELSSARSTARLMVLLPLVTLGLAAGTGSTPWRLLVSEPLGVACLGGGVVLSLTGLLWIDRIADGVVRR